MNLSYAKEQIAQNVGKKLHFIYRGVRNQIEEFSGVITKCFPSVFIVETDDNVTKSFTYSDYIVKNIKIIK